MSFLTCFWLLPQKEHLTRSLLSPMRATCYLRLPTTLWGHVLADATRWDLLVLSIRRAQTIRVALVR